MEYTKPTLSYDCITDNPGFHTVCLDRWVLQAAWLVLSSSTEVQHMKVLSTKSLAIVRTDS